MRPRTLRPLKGWPLRRLVRAIGAMLFLATFAQELLKPREQRTWQGRLLGVLPYDYRPLTWSRLKEAFWNADDPHLFTPRPMGIGWAVNVYEVRRRLSGGERPAPAAAASRATAA